MSRNITVKLTTNLLSHLPNIQAGEQLDLIFATRKQGRICVCVYIYIYIYIYIYKVTFSRCRPGVAQRVGRGIALLFYDRGTRRG